VFGQNEFSWVPPLDIPIQLSGTFGELRNNHFHAGIDIRTQGRRTPRRSRTSRPRPAPSPACRCAVPGAAGPGYRGSSVDPSRSR